MVIWTFFLFCFLMHEVFLWAFLLNRFFFFLLCTIWFDTLFSFSFVIKNLLISSLISSNPWLFVLIMSFSFQVFGFSSTFYLLFPFLSIMVWKYNGYGSVVIYLTGICFCPSMWFILKNIPGALKKNVNLAFCGWRAIYMSVKFHSFKDSVFLLILFVWWSIKTWQGSIKIYCIAVDIFPHIF